jgi:hypothetical protein
MAQKPAPDVHLTFDLQVLDSLLPDTAVLLGLRLKTASTSE